MVDTSTRRPWLVPAATVVGGVVAAVALTNGLGPAGPAAGPR